MKNLIYVSANTRKLYKQLISLRGTKSFTKTHEKQIDAIERMDDYLNPNKRIPPLSPFFTK
jgi:hypothetical protein